MTAPALAPVDQGRIYFDATANKFKVSENNGAYVDLVVTGGGGAGGWTDGGTNVYLTTSTDNVGIGTDSPITQLQVTGNIPSSALGSVATGTQPWSVYLQGRYAYVVNLSTNTLQIFDVSNPAAPMGVGSIAVTGSGPNAVFVQGRYAYVTVYGSNWLQIFDVSNPAAPQSVLGLSALV